MVIHDGFTRLTEGGAVVVHPETLGDKVATGEGISTEFKATLRVNLHTGEKDPPSGRFASLRTKPCFQGRVTAQNRNRNRGRNIPRLNTF